MLPDTTNVYHTFSDFTMRKGRCAIAFLVVQFGPRCCTIIKRKHRVLSGIHESYVGEIIAITAAVKALPDGCVAVVNSDLDRIHQYLKMDDPPAPVYEPLRQLKDKASRLEKLVVQYIPKGHRNSFFHWCHCACRAKADMRDYPDPIGLEYQAAE